MKYYTLVSPLHTLVQTAPQCCFYDCIIHTHVDIHVHVWYMVWTSTSGL